MIKALATRVREQLDEIDELERAMFEANDIQATLNVLTTVHQRVTSVVSEFHLLRQRLPPEQAHAVASRLDGLQQDLSRSRDEFAHQRRQVAILETIQSRAVRIEKDLADGWREAAQTKAVPLLQLLSLVWWLPELREQAPSIRELAARIKSYVGELPRTGERLRAFDSACHQLEDQLVTVQGLSDHVRWFLTRVVNGSATLADVSDDVLAWCRQEDRGGAFSVVFPRATAE